jgi:hypothetical protein
MATIRYLIKIVHSGMVTIVALDILSLGLLKKFSDHTELLKSGYLVHSSRREEIFLSRFLQYTFLIYLIASSQLEC